MTTKKIVRYSKDWREKMMVNRLDKKEGATKLHGVRVRSKLSQAEVAEHINMSASAYGEIERGKRMIRPETAGLLQDLLGQSVKSMFSVKGRKMIAILEKR